MRYSLYVDRIFFLHFCLYLALLWLTAGLGDFQTTKKRLCLAAATGAIGYLGLLLLPTRGLKAVLLVKKAGYLGCGLLALQLAFRFRRRESLLRAAVLYGSGCCVLGGVLGACRGLADSSANSLWQVLLPALVTVSCGLLLIRREQILQKLPLWQVSLVTKRGRVTIPALMDSGNSLCDPCTGAPVCIADQQTADELGLLEDEMKIHLIPYRSIGKQHGLMQASAVEEMYLEKKGQERRLTGIMVAVSSQKLSAGGHYRMLLHPALLEEKRGENHDIESSSTGKDAV